MNPRSGGPAGAGADDQTPTGRRADGRGETAQQGRVRDARLDEERREYRRDERQRCADDGPVAAPNRASTTVYGIRSAEPTGAGGDADRPLTARRYLQER